MQTIGAMMSRSFIRLAILAVAGLLEAPAQAFVGCPGAVSRSVSPRSFAETLIARHRTMSQLSPVAAQRLHLEDQEALALKLAQQASAMPPRQARAQAIGALLELWKREGTTMLVYQHLAWRIPYRIDRVAAWLEEARGLDIEHELRLAVRERTLTIAKLFELSLHWALAASVSEAIRTGEPFSLRSRALFRLHEWLSGQREAFISLFPAASFSFHQTPRSIETLVEASAAPIFHLRLAQAMVRNAAEDETVSPLEDLLHDIFHSARRLQQSFAWLFPDRPALYFPRLAEEGREGAERRLALDPSWMTSLALPQREQSRFHASIFEAASLQPAPVQAAIELIWFQIYLAEPQYGPNASMSPDGLKSLLSEFNWSGTFQLSRAARSGEFGGRYAAVTFRSLRQARSVLRQLADRYAP